MRVLFSLLLLLLLPAAAAQPVALFGFEGPGGDTQGWTPDANSAEVRTVTSKPIGMGQTIGAFEGEWMLDAGVDGLDPLPLSTEWRAITRLFPSRMDLSATPLLRLAASGYAFGSASRRHEFRITVSGGGHRAQQTYVGLKDDPGETFVNAWQVLELDLTGFAGLGQVEEFRVEYRNDDDGTGGTPGPAPWGGRFQIDAVEAVATGLSAPSSPLGAEPLHLEFRPNPARSTATASIASATGDPVRVVLHDVLGREVRTVYEGRLLPGVHQAVRIELGGIPPGLYFGRIVSETASAATRLAVIR